MGSISNTVYYCSVWTGGRVLYAYNGEGDHEMEKLAILCLEKAPSHHKWYFQTMFKKTFGFLMEDEYVYFAIVDENLGNSGLLKFLEHVREEFKKVAKKGSSRNISNSNSLVLHEQLVPVIRRLIASLEHITKTTDIETLSSPYNDSNGQNDNGASTKAPLLGKQSKQDKRKMRDHVVSVRENEVIEEQRKSVDRGGGIKGDSSFVDSSGTQVDSVGAISLTKEMGSMRSRSNSQTLRNKWCRQVRIVLAVDVAVCLILFVVWIVVCRGTECLH